MTSIYDFIEDVNEKLYRMVQEMECVSARELGLDARCGMLSVNEECIIVDKNNDCMLQYYGGFEYVDKDFRNAIGDYVIYTNGDDDRVARCLEYYYDKENVND